MVELRQADAGLNNFHFAQVDCAANGDLCHKNGVKYYPSIYLYVDGEVYDEYSGTRSVKALSDYVDENMPGKVVWLDNDGNAESKGGPAATKFEESEGKAAEAISVVALHVASGEDESPAAPFKSLLDDASTPSPAPTAPATSTTIAISKTTEQQPAAAFITQMRKQTTEEKRNVSGSSNPSGEVQILQPDDVSNLKHSEAKAAFVKYYAPWYAALFSRALSSSLTLSSH